MIAGIPIRPARNAVQAAVNEATTRFGVDLPNEPEAIRHLLTSLETRINQIGTRRFDWRAITINAANGTESRTGADLVGLLSVDVPGIQLAKGFLAQAKMEDALDATAMRRLREQCELMLEQSPSSFVLTLGPTRGVRVYPALPILRTTEPLSRVYSLSLPTFMERHFRSFIGDRALAGSNLAKLLEENRRSSLRVLAISLSPRGDGLTAPDSDEGRRQSLQERLEHTFADAEMPSGAPGDVENQGHS